jgi:predicted DNA-binding transcriptional regulator AlpA
MMVVTNRVATEATMTERMMTSGEVAKQLGISTGWIRRLELEGEIPPARRLSRFRVYTLEETRRGLKARAVQGAIRTASQKDFICLRDQS